MFIIPALRATINTTPCRNLDSNFHAKFTNFLALNAGSTNFN